MADAAPASPCNQNGYADQGGLEARPNH